MRKNIVSKTPPFVAAAALVYPGTRKLADGGWREELSATYQSGNQNFGQSGNQNLGQSGNQNFGEGFFLLIGALEVTMAGFFVGALWRRSGQPTHLWVDRSIRARL